MDPLAIPSAGAALLLRLFIVQPFYLPAGSMMPTLEVSDYVFVDKTAYGYNRFSLSPLFELPEAFWSRQAPERGDIVVFRTPQDTSVDYVKRVIAIAGDRVQVTDGIVYLNGKALTQKRKGPYAGSDPAYADAVIYVEALPSGRSYEIMDMGEFPDADNTQEFVVPEGHFFVLGDNRDNSNDSRFTTGYVPYENLVGKFLVCVDYHGKRLKAKPLR